MELEKHGVDWTVVKRSNPHFFKVLVGDFAKSLKIPPKFLKHLAEEMEVKPSGSNTAPILTAILEGPTGRTWHVEIEKKNNGMFFTSGWSRFVKDHSLKVSEMLIFRYNGFMQFTVLMFDKTACEKEVADDLSEIEGRTKNNLAAKRKLHFDVELISSNSSEDNSSEEDEEELVIEKSKGKDGTKGRKNWETLAQIRSTTVREKSKTQKAAQSFASKNPFFVIGLSSRLVFAFRFPMRFSRKYLPREKCKFSLRVKRDKAWEANYIPSEKDRDFLSKGWLDFARENMLQEDDFCVFELVKPTEFRVHIFRAVELEVSATSTKARKKVKA